MVNDLVNFAPAKKQELDKTAIGAKLAETLKIYGKKLSIEFPRAAGVTLEQFMLLSVLDKNADLIQQKLADLMKRDKSGVLRLVNALEKKQMVIRTPDKNDRRKKNLELTGKGREALNKCFEREAEIIGEILEGVDDRSVAVFSEVLSKIQANSNEWFASC